MLTYFYLWLMHHARVDKKYETFFLLLLDESPVIFPINLQSETKKSLMKPKIKFANKN